MTRRGSRGRAGITLTEILISIMIMGVGLVSLATLFPLGLMRLRAAAMRTRSAFLVESADADMAARNLLSPARFSSMGYTFDPLVRDNSAFPWTPATLTNGVASSIGPGLPVAYDPLWRAVTGIFPIDAPEARFATGTNIRTDPGGATAAAYGLQRLTSFPNTANNNSIVVPNIFVSPDDIVFQSPTGTTGVIGSASPLVPDLSTSTTPVIEWTYTWMFTGRRSDVSDESIYEGDLVIFHGRPLAVDGPVAAGETVVEAVFGYSANVLPSPPTLPLGSVGYGTADRVVLLRWPATEPDPEVRVGSWIADVTYERVLATNDARQTAVASGGAGAVYPGQRCHWYQVVKKTPADTAVPFTGDGQPYRSMTVVVNTPVRAKTPLVAASGEPFQVNVALVSRYVVNVFPRTFTTR